ncbi:MAG: hypothetical protein EOM91_13760 [Sphingobacteriia bacterium]|nr:hypothetical protein [Sphingobacteriia bacterium]NCC40994.1 hypothetical protein [Gammaproteobacteria bacterium]
MTRHDTGVGSMTLALPESARRFGTPELAATLAREISAWPPDRLPLHGAQGGLIEPGSIGVTVLSCTPNGQRIDLLVGVFFTEVVGGCSCGEEPFAVPGYQEWGLGLDRATGAVLALTVR